MSYSHLLKSFQILDGNSDGGHGTCYRFYDISKLDEIKFHRLPFSIRVLLEAAVRKCDNFQILEHDIMNILNWEDNQKNEAVTVDVPFQPGRVILQDFTGVPAVVDFAAMRDAVHKLGKNWRFLTYKTAASSYLATSDLYVSISVIVL